jgi:hypothetical protein
MLAAPASQIGAAQEWPRLEPEPMVAQGFRPSLWAEFQWREGTWEPTRRHRRYDPAGRLVEVSMLVAKKGRPWAEALKLSHEYDPSGRRVASVTQGLGRSGRLEDTMREQYAYDRDDNQMETLFQSMRNGMWIDGRKETLGYERTVAAPR